MQSFAHFSLFCASKLRVMKKNIAIFASGSGSNAENIIRYFQKNDSVQVSLVLSNKSDAYVLERTFWNVRIVWEWPVTCFQRRTG